MRIAVHAKVLSEDKPNGIGVYAYNLLKAISGIDAENEYTLYSNKPIVQKISAANFKEKIFNFPAGWSYIRFPFEFLKRDHDLLFVPKEFVPPLFRPKTVVACYGFGKKTVKEEHLSAGSWLNMWIGANYALRVADSIIAISESVKSDIVENCGIGAGKITVTHLGYDEELYKPYTDKELQGKIKLKYGIKGRFVINTASLLWHRKNITRLIAAFKLFKSRSGSDYQLLITGKRGESYEEIVNLISSLDLKKDVILTDYVPIDDMPLLLNAADFMVFPSLHEGFGLSVLEAMACGCPVITSNVSSLPEVVGDAGILIDPYKIEEIASAMEHVAVDGAIREKMKQKGSRRAKTFSWERTARETLKVFEGV